MFGLFGRSEKVSSLLVSGAEMEAQERKKRITEAWRRYGGMHPAALKATGTDPDAKDNTSVNMARRTVDIGAFYLFGKGLEFEVGEKGKERDPRDKWLADCWQKNLKASFLLEFAISGGVAGDGFIRVHPPRLGEQFPRLTSLDAATVEVEWDPADYREARRILIEFNAVDRELKRAQAHRHRIERNAEGAWEIIEEVSNGDSSGWLVISSEVWPWPFCPVFHCKNRPLPHCYYGASDTEGDVLGLNDAINFVISNLNRILRVHGHPLTYLAGQQLDKKTGLDRAVDGILVLPNPNAKVDNVAQVTELTPHFEQLKELRQAFHELTSIPEIASGKFENIGQLSGLALKILYGPLIQLIEMKRIFYGEMLVALCQALLLMAGFGDGLPVEIQWPEILPEDPKEAAEAAVMKQEAGVSRDTTITELGYDAEKEAEKRAEEAEQATRRFNAGAVPETSDLPIGGQDGDLEQ